jgi:methyl-accepting chemotaxis protein
MVRIALMGMASMVTVILIVIGVSRSVTSPLSGIARRMKEISRGDGDLAHRITVLSRDEMGELADSFNVFVGKVHDIVSAVRDNTEGVGEAAARIRTASVRLSKGAFSQQADIEKAVLRAQEIASSMARHSEFTHTAANVANTTRTQAERGSHLLAEHGRSMETIHRSALKTQDVLETLRTHAGQILGLTESIHDVASRTKVLALNATIEAVRAGAAGAGFLVLSREIRTLAVRSGEAARTISEMLQTVSRDMGHTLKAVQEVLASVEVGTATNREMEAVLSGAITSFSLIANMIAGMEEDAGRQSEGAREIQSRIEAIGDVSRDTAVSSEHLAAAADQMNIRTNDLRILVNRFRLQGWRSRALDPAGRATAAAAPAPHEAETCPVA